MSVRLTIDSKLLACKMFNGNSATLKLEFKLSLYKIVFWKILCLMFLHIPLEY